MKFLDRFFGKVDKKEALSWAMFDFANSAYYLIIISFVFPIYFKDVIAGAQYGDFYWGLIVSISILAGGLAAPIIGAIADYDTRRKSKFISFTLISIIGTALLFFAGKGFLFISGALFVVTNFFYNLAVVLYDSFLAHVSTKETVSRISGLGWGLGYVGGIIALLALKPLYGGGYEGTQDFMYRLAFPLTALYFLIFSLPAFFFIREHRQIRKKRSAMELIKIGFGNVTSTLKNIKKHRNIAKFFLGFYFLNDALVTLFAFIPLFAKNTFHFSMTQIMIMIFIIHVIGFPSAIFFGLLADKKGPKKTLVFSIIIWCFVIILLSLNSMPFMLYICSALAGLVIGSSQAVARSWLAQMVPEGKRCQFFGFNGFASKISATTGPIIFGLIASFASNQRLAVIVLLPFFIISAYIFSRIKE